MGFSLLRRLIVIVVCSPCWLPAGVSATARITVGDAVVGDGKAVVEIRLDADGETVGGMQNDILWDERAIQLERTSDCVLRAEIGDRLEACEEDLPVGPCKTLTRHRVVCGNEPSSPGCEGQSTTTARFRGIVAATVKPNNNSIPDGVLYTCTFRVVDPERLPIVLVNEHVVLSDPFGVRLEVVAADGAVLAEPGSVRPSRPPTPAVPPTATPRPTRTFAPATSPVATATLRPTPTSRPTWTRAPSRPPSPSGTPSPTPTPSATWTPTRAAQPGDVVVAVVAGLPYDDEGRLALDIDVVLEASDAVAAVGGVQLDLLFDTRAVRLEGESSCRIDPAIGDDLDTCRDDPASLAEPCKTLSRNLVRCGASSRAPGCEGRPPMTGRFRGIIAATAVPNHNRIPDGAVLLTCRFTVVDENRLPAVVEAASVVASDPFGTRLQAIGYGAVLGEGFVPRTSTPTSTRTPTRTFTLAPTITPTLPPTIENGDSCSAAWQCLSGYCARGTCCASACPAWRSCDVTGDEGVCREQLRTGESCGRDSDCLSYQCDGAGDASPGVCAEVPDSPWWNGWDEPITMIVGPPAELDRAPRRIAVGDVDGDRLADAIVAVEDGTDLLLLRSTGFGSLAAPEAVAFGQKALDLDTGDVDGDGFLDIAAVDDEGTIAVLYGLGDGVFSEPVFYGQVSGASEIAVADVDLDGDEDLLVLHREGTFAFLRLLTNDGEAREFAREAYGFPIAGVAPAFDLNVNDLNGDGYPDVAVFSPTGLGTTAVVVLFNNGSGRFLRQSDSSIGGVLVAMAIADIEGDGDVDIVVLATDPSSESTVGRSYNLVPLISLQSGAFRTGELQKFTCPAAYNGDPIRCAPRDIVATDGNRDGLVDLFVSVEITLAADSGITTPGLVDGLVGNAGTFELSTSMQVGHGPHQLVTAEFTGDGLGDLVVAEIGPRPSGDEPPSVAVIREVPPPPRVVAESCRVSSQCSTGACVNGFCCDARCGPDQRCDMPEREGACQSLGASGSRCSDAAHCQSGFCVEGFCCASDACVDGEFCNSGLCALPGDLGVPCRDDQQCESGACTDGTCCEAPACPPGQACHIPGMEGLCRARLDLGDACSRDTQCFADSCTNGFCCSVDECGSGQSCGVAGKEGDCAVLPTATSTPTATPTPQPIGFTCLSSSDCRVGDCVDGTCCAAAFCPPNQYCNISGVAGTCAPRRLQGAGCDQDSDCVFANCDLHFPGGGHAGICGAWRTPTPLSPGDRCVEDRDCRIGLVCNVWESTCCEDDPCPSGYTCRNAAYPGVCVPLPTPTPLRFPNPEPCDANAPEVCATGYCVDGVCCDRPACAVGERCDIAPFPGTCHEPLTEGADCAKDLDCEGMLRCLDLDGSGKVCAVRPRTPTSAPRVATPTEPPRRPTIVLYDDEGCAVGEPNGTPWWLLVGVAAGILARRREAWR